MAWIGLCMLTLGWHFVPSAALVVTRNRDHFNGLNLKSIDFETPYANDSNEADVYSDLKYLKGNTTAGYISPQANTLFITSQASIASQTDAFEMPIKKMSISANNNPRAMKVNNDSCINGTISPARITKAFDMFNQMLGIVSLVELLMLSLLVFISKWDTLVALLTCNRKALCKPNLDAMSNPGSHGSAGGLLQKNLQILSKIASFVQVQPAIDVKESTISNAPSGNIQHQQPVNSQTVSESKQAECSSESPLSGTNANPLSKNLSTFEESFEERAQLAKELSL